MVEAHGWVGGVVSRGAELQEAVGCQQRMDPDSIFQPVKTLALEEGMPFTKTTIHHPPFFSSAPWHGRVSAESRPFLGGAVFGTRGSKRFPTFRKRSSSGNWIADRLTWQEQLAYKKSLGFL